MKERVNSIRPHFHPLQPYEEFTFTLLYTNDHDKADCNQYLIKTQLWAN